MTTLPTVSFEQSMSNKRAECDSTEAVGVLDAGRASNGCGRSLLVQVDCTSNREPISRSALLLESLLREARTVDNRADTARRRLRMSRFALCEE